MVYSLEKKNINNILYINLQMGQLNKYFDFSKVRQLGFSMQENIQQMQVENRPRGYKNFFMLNSVEHKILNAHKYKNIKKFGFF